MKRKLIVGDPHIDDYPRNNAYHKSRFLQFPILANLIVDSGRLNNCKELILAGDILNKPVNRPYVSHMLDEFFSILSAGFESVYFIIGQHDTDSKSIIQKLEDTEMTRIPKMYPNVKYMNHEFLVEEDHTTYFMNWKKVQDLSLIKDKVDLFIGHVTVGNGLFEGQEIDNTKFDLAICGDIHAHKVTGNLVSIGCPIQVKIDEPTESPAVVYDPSNKDWRKVDLDPNKLLPRMYYTNDKTLAGPREETNEYYVYRPITKKGLELTTDAIIDEEWNTTQELIDSSIALNDLGDIHDNVLSTMDYSPINFDFTLVRIVVKNVRSLENFEYNVNEGVTLITGLNGSGKSTLLSCIDWGLNGNNKMGDSLTHGTTDNLIQIDIKYENVIYGIIRTNKHGDKLLINGIEQSFNNKRSVNEDIRSRLPFLEFSECFIIQSWMTEILGRMNSASRINLLSKHYRLDTLDEHFNASEALSKEYVVTKNDLNVQVTTNKSQLDQLQLLLNEVNSISILEDLEYDSLLVEVEETNASMATKSDYDKLKLSISPLLTRGKSYEDSKLITTNLILANEISIKLIDKISIDLLVKNKLESRQLIQGTLVNYDNDLKFIITMNEEIDSINANITKLLSGRCYTCDSILTNEKVESELSELRTRLMLKSSGRDNLKNKIANVNIIELNATSTSLLNEINTLNNQLRDLYNLEIEKTRLSTQLINDNNNISNNELLLSREQLLLDKILEGTTEEILDSINVIDLSTKLINLNDLKTINVNYRSLSKSITDKQTLIDNLNIKISDLDIILARYAMYSSLFKKDGKIYTAILIGLTERFTNELFKFHTISTRKNGNTYSDLSVSLNVKGHWTTYSELSSGQKTLCDLYFLFRVMVVKGLVIFDEFFKSVDDHHLEIVIDYLSMFNAKNLLICTHSDNFTMEGSSLGFELNEQGRSVVINN